MTGRSSDPTWLAALADVFVPAIDPVAGDSAEVAALRKRAANDIGIDRLLAVVIPGLPRHVRHAVAVAMDTLPEAFPELPLDAATAAWQRVATTPTTSFGAFVLVSTTCAMFYTAPVVDGRNPSWPALGYSGPLLEPPLEQNFPKTLRHATEPEAHYAVDVVVVGSGAGGGVAAARFAAAGRSVLVLEQGAYRNEPDLPQLEALSFPNLYSGGGYVWSTDGSVACLAGATVGGGTTVNSMACLPTPQRVRAEWAGLGLTGVDTEEYVAHMEAVMARINATSANSRLNKVNELLVRGFDALGLEHALMARNARDDDDRFCGMCNSGCALGCKQSTMKTFLQDASDADALLLERCTAQQICRDGDGRATGVLAQWTGADGRTRQVRVDAPTVVMAAGALSTPLLLARSGIGGERVGRNLHVHPSYFMSGVFDEPVRGWEGQILTAVTREFETVEDDAGFVIEAAPMGLGFWAGLTPWHDGAAHKDDQLRFAHVSGAWAFVRDHGEGLVRADADGRPVIEWGLDDPVDLRVVRRAHVELARILRAAGAKEVFTFLPGDPRWRDGEDFEAFLARLRNLEARDVFTLSAHQSGTARAGADPASTVIDGAGQAHDAPGVYVVDAAALPTAPGVNPMVTIEAWASWVSERALSDRSVPVTAG